MRNNVIFSAVFILVVIVLAVITIKGKSEAPPEVVTQEVKKPLGCSGIPTPSQTEGPYYKVGSPQRNNIAESLPREKLIVTGFVFDKNCKVIPGAWLDFWHADSKGVYDNSGYNLRGHQFTDQDGRYQLETIIPAAYETRPPHIHVKVKTPNGPILITQMYFPNENLNKVDPIFNPALIMEIKDTSTGKEATFNFILQ